MIMIILSDQNTRFDLIATLINLNWPILSSSKPQEKKTNFLSYPID